MADPTPAPGNPANVIGNVVSSTPHRGAVAAERARAGRDATRALIAAGRMDDASAKPSVPAKDPGERIAGPAPSDPEDHVEPEEHHVETETKAPPPAAATVLPPDPDTAKRLGQIQAAERRHREQVAADRTELETKAKGIEREWAPRVKAAEDFEALKAKAKRGPTHLVDVFRALGLGDDDLEPAAQALYAHSKAGAADPARKQQAERMMREREGSDELAATKRRLDELEGKLAAKDQQGQFERLQTDYLDGTVKAIGDDAPIAKALAAKNPQKLRAALWRHTVELTKETGGDVVPEFSEVVARYEAERRAELEELGLAPPPAIAAIKTDDKKPNSQPADKQNPAKTLSADLSAPRVPRDAQSGKDHRAETRRMIESGKFE